MDIAHFSLSGKETVGYLLNSPLEQIVLSKFDYCPKATPDTTKPYRAHWSIHDYKLFLMYANGTINGNKLFTDDFVSNYPDDTVFYHCVWFSGQLRFHNMTRELPEIFETCLIKENELLLVFKNGILERTNKNK